MNCRSVIISGSGTFTPPNTVTNAQLCEHVETSDEWIVSRTGIQSRQLIVKEGEMTTVDMAEKAALAALEMANTTAEELDMIIVGTVTPDYRLPSAACLLQNRLAAKHACAFDVIAACAGSLYGLSIANQFIANGKHQHVLVIGVESMSTILNWSDRNTCVLFGDAASAAILEPCNNSKKGFIDFQLYSDGSHWQDIWIPQGGSKKPVSADTFLDKGDRVLMNGRETFKFAIRALTHAALKILETHNISIDQVNHIVAHQANLRILEAVSERLRISLDRFIINIDRFANTSSASLLLTFDEGKRLGRFKNNELILMLAIGAGFTWGASLYRA
jgi:3-oxoacyl-[acyl-carrier-protein] synthase III